MLLWEQPIRNHWEVYCEDVEWFRDNPDAELRERNLIRGEVPEEVVADYKRIAEESEVPVTFVVTVQRPKEGESIHEWCRLVQVMDLH